MTGNESEEQPGDWKTSDTHGNKESAKSQAGKSCRNHRDADAIDNVFSDDQLDILDEITANHRKRWAEEQASRVED